MAPLAYYAGHRLGAVEYDILSLSLGVIAAAWALILPSLIYFSSKHSSLNKSAVKLEPGEATRHV
jgi:hypothetical protein